MRVLLTGRSGQVGRAFSDRAGASDHQLVAFDRSEFDICDRSATQRIIADLRPELVINAAAYTAVDAAEEDPLQARRVNVEGPRNLALTCKQVGAILVHLSTDFVFDGRKGEPYVEDDLPGPLSEYGRTKLAGERLVRATLERCLVVRLSWVFGPHGRNFVKTILRLAHEREELKVVADQRGCPTYTGDIAEALLRVVDKVAGGSPIAWGVYHFCGSPTVTWHDFALAIVAGARSVRAVRVSEILPITTAEYPLPARRPSNSTLDCRRFAQQFGFSSPSWRIGLADTLEACLGESPWQTRTNLGISG